MISLLHIERLVRAESHDRLIERVLANGRRVGDAVANRLREPDALVPAACGLALQRCCELSYGPTAVAGDLVLRLLAAQRGDGSFGRSLAASAIALRGLLEYANQQYEVGEAVDERAAAGAARGLAWLRRVQSADGCLGGDLEASAIVLWQLADHEAFRSAVRFDALVDAVDRSFEAGLPEGLCRLASAAA